MAKRKTPKVKKPAKVTNEELGKIQKIVNTINQAQNRIGMLHTSIHQLLHHIAGHEDELTLIKSELEKTYGTSDVDILDGTINYNGKAN